MMSLDICQVVFISCLLFTIKYDQIVHSKKVNAVNCRYTVIRSTVFIYINRLMQSALNKWALFRAVYFGPLRSTVCLSYNS